MIPLARPTLAWLFATCMACWSFANEPLQVRFVATTGSDARGDGSSLRPWASIGHGINKLKPSETLIVRDGVYSGQRNLINSRLISIPSGTRHKPTVIRAERPFGARIRNDKPLNYYDNLLRLDENVQDVVIDGFIFDQVDSLHPSYVVEIGGTRITLSRIIVRRGGVVDEYGGWIALGGSDNLVEDCAGTGAARYGFYTGGPTAKHQRNIFRRCVGRLDFSPSRQPKATFAVYGNDRGNEVRDILLQNCVAIDGQRGPRGGEETYAGFYFPKNATNVTVQGSIALNLDVGYAGFFVRELGGANIRLEHSIAWNIHGAETVAGFRINGKTDDPVNIKNLTVGSTRHGYYNRDRSRHKSLTDSLFIDVQRLAAGEDAGWAAERGNRNLSSAMAGAALAGTFSASQAMLTGPASPGGRAGATIRYRYGRSGSRWGEAGFDELTREELWPWPYEDEIRRVFAEPNPPQAGNMPSTNDTTRGFAGRSTVTGENFSLTTYIWQSIGVDPSTAPRR
jgi:hypothetical protein